MLLAFADTPQCHGLLTVFPVVAADEPELSYLLVADALGSGVLSIQEHGGHLVPHFIARNQGALPILVLDCEEFPAGANEKKRSTNRSILLGPNSTTRFPVSCMEGGRRFPAAGNGDFSRTIDTFPILEGQVGVLAFLGQQFLGLDVLGCPSLYAAVHRRLLAAYLLDTLSPGNAGLVRRPTSEAEVLALAEALERAERVPEPGAGHGDYSTLQGSLAGGELRHNGHLVHLSVFPEGMAA